MAGVWRTGRLTYRGRLDEVPVAAEGPRRERIQQTVAAEAAAFERIIARAPDQWGAVFAPIWPDLEAEAAGSGSADDASAKIHDAAADEQAAPGDPEAAA
jgi:hypothetical protein